VLAAAAGIESIIRRDTDLVFTVRRHAALEGLFDGAAGSVRLPDERTIHWRPPRAYLEPATLPVALLERLRQPRQAV